MKSSITKQKLINSLTGLATASLLAASPAVFAAGGSASAGNTGAGDQQQTTSANQNAAMGQQDQQRMTGTQNSAGTQNSEWNQNQDSQELGANTSERDSEGLAGSQGQSASGNNSEEFNTAGSGGNLNQTDEQQSFTNSDINQNEEQGVVGTGTSDANLGQNPDTNIDSQSNQQAGQQLSSVSPDELQDRQVVNQNGEDLGDVQEVITDADGSVSGVVVSVGGILGMGATDVYASAEELELEQDQLVWQTSLDEDALSERQEYEAASAN